MDGLGDENCARMGGRGKMLRTLPKEKYVTRGVEDVAPYKASFTNAIGVGNE